MWNFRLSRCDLSASSAFNFSIIPFRSCVRARAPCKSICSACICRATFVGSCASQTRLKVHCCRASKFLYEQAVVQEWAGTTFFRTENVILTFCHMLRMGGPVSTTWSYCLASSHSAVNIASTTSSYANYHGKLTLRLSSRTVLPLNLAGDCIDEVVALHVGSGVPSPDEDLPINLRISLLMAKI
jgi:hypothetical protein